MTFWFCTSCRTTWHSYIISPVSVKRIRCFSCLQNTAIRLKDEKLKKMDGIMTYDDYLWFKKNNGRITKRNGFRKKLHVYNHPS